MIDKFYKKLFIENQGKGKYLMFTFDIKDSKLMESKVRLIAQYQIIELVERIYQDLIMLEKELDKEILIHDINYKKIMDGCDNTFAHRHEPFILGDMVGITILTNSIPPEVVLSIFDLNKKELDITFDFHISYGNYETDDYGLGGVEAFRGYAITILSNVAVSLYLFLISSCIVCTILILSSISSCVHFFEPSGFIASLILSTISFFVFSYIK